VDPSRITINQKELLVFSGIEEIAEFFVVEWQRISEIAIRGDGSFNVALSGGRTPVRVYERLSELKAYPYWDSTHIFLVDERHVPFDHPDSNYHMIRQTLLDHIEIPEENIHPIPVATHSPEESARRYESEIRSFFRLRDKGLPRFNLILLGIGEDGHIASLFPATSSFKEEDRLIITTTPPEPYRHKRITITLPVINNAENIIFVVTGEGKSGVLRRVILEQDRQLPATLVRPAGGRLIFLTDRASACLLK